MPVSLGLFILADIVFTFEASYFVALASNVLFAWLALNFASMMALGIYLALQSVFVLSTSKGLINLLCLVFNVLSPYIILRRVKAEVELVSVNNIKEFSLFVIFAALFSLLAGQGMTLEQFALRKPHWQSSLA
ncbi:hypothetical protein [Ferrimonas marina]|nr:hypothetical protein [Ferrimonas marina]